MSNNTPKTEKDNGSDPDPTKIKPFTWPSLAKPMKLPHSQKRSVRPLFSILLLIVFAATVSFRAVLRRANVNLSLSAWSLQKKAHVLNFNSTLLKYASVDISEPRAKQEIACGRKQKDEENEMTGCWFKFRFIGSCMSSKSKVDGSMNGTSTLNMRRVNLQMIPAKTSQLLLLCHPQQLVLQKVLHQLPTWLRN